MKILDFSMFLFRQNRINMLDACVFHLKNLFDCHQKELKHFIFISLKHLTCNFSYPEAKCIKAAIKRQ